MQGMKSVESIIQAFGREAIIEACGVTSQAISNAKARGHFHGLWYGQLAKLAEKQGKVLPRDAFMWREPDKAPA